MINKVVHLADVHIKNDLETHPEYIEQFNKIYKELEELKPDRILVAGDITHDFLSCSYEVEILAVDFIVNLTNIAKTIVVEGNHCIRKSDLKRTSALRNFVTTIKKANPGIDLIHYDKSGFFEDENIIWVNHSHMEKKINPWEDIKHTKQNDKTYIDVFHDPVYGCSNDLNYLFDSKKLRKPSNFKGDLGMFGDIHKFQYMNKQKTMAYCGSTIQQDFGETPDKHGYMVWDIKNKVGELVEVQTDYTKISFNIEQGFDYDNIDFNHNLITEKSYIKIKWSDLNSEVNEKNENLINNYFKEKYNIEKENIIYEKSRIYADMVSSKMLTETVDVNDKGIQRDIFIEYLKATGYDDKFIENILDIDETVNSMIEDTSVKLQSNWKIKSFWLDNFKSFDYEKIDWEDMNGIIQIFSNENQMGKSTILDGICYITHGTTFSTHKIGGGKKEKHGDNRYINNKRDLDYCSGGMVIDINNNTYTIIRKTNREWNKKKGIKSVTTSVEYYDGEKIDEKFKLVGERKTDTQKKLDALIGDFNDFIRLTLINADNMNTILSMDRATFIDSVVQDAGFEIFEKKLEVFKVYKKSLTLSKINIDVSKSEVELEDLNTELSNLRNKYIENQKYLSEIDTKIDLKNLDRDNLFKKLNKIDESIVSINVNDYKEKLIEYNNSIKDNETKKDAYSKQLNLIIDTYDEEEYESSLQSLKTIENSIIDNKLSISKFDNSTIEMKSKLETIKLRTEQVLTTKITEKNKEIKNIEIEIDKINVEFDKKIAEAKSDLKFNINDIEYKIKNCNISLNNIKEEGIKYKKEIQTLEESKVCPTCLRPYEEDDHEHLDIINNKKNELENKIISLKKDGVKYKEDIVELNIDIKNIEQNIEDIELGSYIGDLLGEKNKSIELIDKLNLDIDEIKSDIELLESGDTELVKADLEKLKEFKEKVLNKIESNKTEKAKIEIILKSEIDNKEKNQKNLIILKQQKDDHEKYNSLKLAIERLEINIEKYNNGIVKFELLIEKYEKSLIYIEENKYINSDISIIDNELRLIKIDKTDLIETNNDVKTEGELIKPKIELVKNNILIYKEQVRKEELFKQYQKCVSREGIPTFLLLKSKDLINYELSDILSTVNFNVFFDDKLNLKMYMESRTDVFQNVLEGSGAERTFAAIALKLALRSININSRPNFLMLDEITGKLKGKSIDNFNKMVDKLKNRIDKVIIIEQNHPISYDYYIEVTKDEHDISSLEIK